MDLENLGGGSDLNVHTAGTPLGFSDFASTYLASLWWTKHQGSATPSLLWLPPTL